jgi:hypothetical protein
VLSELGSQAGGGTSYTFVGGADHAVSCLSYGDNTVAAAQALALSDAEIARTQQALAAARLMVNPSAGILGVAIGKSSDRSGEAAVIVYENEGMQVNVPSTVEGVRTVVIPTNTRAVAIGAAPMANAVAGSPSLAAGELNQAMSIKRQLAQSLMQHNTAFFGVGVGRSLDNPKEAALVIYVDRKRIPGEVPRIVDGLRTRVIVMDRLHVTRAFVAPFEPRLHCMPHAKAGFDPTTAFRSGNLNLF